MDNRYDAAITADRIKQVADKAGIKISQLNSICGLSENTIKNAGKSKEGMKARNLFLIAEVLNCSVDYLLGRTDNPQSVANTHIEQTHSFVENDSSPILVVSPSDNQLDDIHQELLTYFDKLSFKDKAEIMKMVAEKAEC